jgi:hypothetical protein
VTRWIVLLGALAVAASAIGVGYRHEVQQRTRDDFAAEGRNIGLSAALTADMMRWAHRQCSPVGMATLSACSARREALTEGHLAAPLARIALDQYARWTASCNRHYPAGYCQDLIDRELRARGVSR